MDLNAEQISILLIVPFKTEPIPLDLDVIYHPQLTKGAGLSKFPYITSKLKYPTRLLQRVMRGGYKNIVSFFFNKSQFETILYREIKDSTSGYSRTMNADQENVILQGNIMIMLKMLFPAYYPAFPNVSTSYDEYILQSGQNISYKMGGNNISYVKIDGTPYTITKTVFLNDFVNHPVYKNVTKQYIQYSIWAEKQKNIIERDLLNSMNKLWERFTIKDGKQGDLNILDSIKAFENMVEPEKEPAEKTIISKAEDDKRLFRETLLTLIQSMKELKEKTIIDNLYMFYESINNIKELYSRLTSYNLMKKKPVDFDTRINRLFEEIKKLVFVQKIKDEYIVPRNINVKLEDENQELVNIIRSKYKPYIDFVEVIRSIIKPLRESTNSLLQESINNYSQNKDSDKLMKFSDIIQNVYDTYVLRNKSNSNVNLIKYMNVGVGMINSDEQNKPRYEIYISMNMIETEYTIETMNSIKCIYDGFALGKDFENKLNDVNPYDITFHSFFLSNADIKSKQTSSEMNVPVSQAPAPPAQVPEKRGGWRSRRKSRKQTMGKLRKTVRHTRRRYTR